MTYPLGKAVNLFLHKSTMVTSAVEASSNTSSGICVRSFMVKLSDLEFFIAYLQRALEVMGDK